MSTGLRPFLQTPSLQARSFATGQTAASSPVSTLAELANDAAGGSPAQRMTLGTMTGVLSGSTYLASASTYYYPTGAARFLRVCAQVANAYQTFSVTMWAKFTLSVVDALGTVVASSSASIPYGLKGDVQYGTNFAGNAESNAGLFGGQRPVFWLDVDELIAAGLDPTAGPWRFAWSFEFNQSFVYLGGLQVEERSQFLIDEAADFGQLPGDYLPRGAVVDGTPQGLQRLWETVRAGNMLNLRTYHGMTRTTDDPWLTTSTTFAPFGGDTESAGVAARYRVRGRRMREATACPVRWIVYYKFTGGSAGDTATVQLTTGTGSTALLLTWVDNTNWYSSTVKTGATLDNTTTHDELYWQAKVSNAASTLRIASRYVFDNPSP